MDLHKISRAISSLNKIFLFCIKIKLQVHYHAPITIWPPFRTRHIFQHIFPNEARNTNTQNGMRYFCRVQNCIWHFVVQNTWNKGSFREAFSVVQWSLFSYENVGIFSFTFDYYTRLEHGTLAECSCKIIKNIFNNAQ